MSRRALAIKEAREEESPMVALEKRITSALVDAIASAAIAELIAETESAIAIADEAAEQARTKALDPLLSPDATKARAAMEDAAFIRDRLRTVLPRLQARFRQVSLQERYDAWVIDYDNIKLARDALAKELTALYPEYATRIINLLLRIEAVDLEVKRVASRKPYEAPAANGDGRNLREVELEARGLEAFSTHAPSIIKNLRLPHWQPSELPAWPPHRPADQPLVFHRPGRRT
jgi:hypothetical protein